MFQTRKEKAKKTLFRSSHHQRKLHHIHMAVSDVKWSDNIYSIKEVIHTYRLPLLVKVTQGHFTGPDEDSLSQGQIVRLADSQRIKRVKARDVRGRIITMPLTFPIPLGIIPYNMSTIRGKLSKFRQLKLHDLVRRYQLPQRVKISSKHFSKRELLIPGVDLTSDGFDLVELYEEVVLQGNAINFGNLDETPLNIPLRNSEMEVVIGLGLKQGTQTEWDALHAGLTERFNRKVRLPKIVDGKGILIVHQVPSSNQRQLSSPGSEYSYGEASIPSRETRYKKRLDTQSVGSTLPNRYRTNEKKQRRLVKVDEDNLSFDGSETSSGIASPDGARSPVFPPDFSPSGDNFFLGGGESSYSPPRRSPDPYYSERRRSEDVFGSLYRNDVQRYNLDIDKTTHNPLSTYGRNDQFEGRHREDYPDHPRHSTNPFMDKAVMEPEGSTDSGNATWYNSGENLYGDPGESEMNNFGGNTESVRPQMIQDYLHSVERDTIVRNKQVMKGEKNMYLRSKMANTNSTNRRGKSRFKSRSVQDFNVADTPLDDEGKARSMYDLDDQSSSLSRPRDLFGTVAKINRFRPSMWSSGWGNPE